jgi:hypothetical protein
MRKGRDRYDRRARTFAWRIIYFVSQRPLFAFGLSFVLVTALTLARSRDQLRALYLILFPFILFIMLVLNLPFLTSAFRQFRMSEAAKVNHALEHGTLFFLRRRYGRKFRLGGRAREEGFRLNGLPSPDDITPAFRDLCEHLARGDTRPVIHRYCGSNIVTAQGYAIVLLALSAPLLLFVPLRLQTQIGILAFNLGAYLVLRRPLGHWMQRHFFMSLAFRDASIQSINQVKPVGRERRHVFFVRTLVTHESGGTRSASANGLTASPSHLY